jgi:lysophospholipase L1-like esterase
MRLLALLAAVTGLAFLPALSGVVDSKPSTATQKKKRPAPKRRRVSPPPRVSAATRTEAKESVDAHLEATAGATIQNPAALIPFFEILYRHRSGDPGPVRVLQFGDSHTASDEWTGALRTRFQTQFGDGGPGFVHAGRPFAGFHRLDAKTAMSSGWKADGLLKQETDGLNGIAGVSVATERAGETLTLDAEAANLEVFYWQRPGGGSMTLEADGALLARIETAGESGPGYYHTEVQSGPHRFTLRTESDAPVRVFGWVAENRSGVTWETLGINGAQADLLLGWNDELLSSHLARRDPALIVVAYGTNEARRAEWTYETYKAAFAQVLARLRAAAPAASILVVGPPDQSVRARGRWSPAEGVDRIVAAQRDAAVGARCAFWNLRAGMGGKGSMKQWVYAGLAQGDFVHFTSPGYKLLGESLYGLLMDQYGVFATVRRQWIGTQSHGPSSKDN